MFSRFAVPIAILFAVLAVWEGIVYFLDIPRYILPAPSKNCGDAICGTCAITETYACNLGRDAPWVCPRY